MPRIVPGGVVSGDDFVDRDDLLREIWSYLPRQGIDLVAPRRWGKTSIMKRLEAEPRHGCCVRFIDCQAFDEPYLFPAALHEALLEGHTLARVQRTTGEMLASIWGWLRRIRPTQVGVDPEGRPTISLDLDDPAGPSWKAAVERLLQAARLNHNGTVVVVDEFPMMLENCLEKSVAAETLTNLLGWFRLLRLAGQYDASLAFVLGGSISLDFWLRRLNAGGSTSDLHRVEVPPFDRQVALQFVADLLNGAGMVWDDGVPAAVLREIDPPMPFWIQKLVALLPRQGLKPRPISVDAVGEVYRKQVIGVAGRQYFQPWEDRLNRWGELEAKAAKAVLTELSSVPYQEGVHGALLRAVFTRIRGDDDASRFHRILADLQTEFYIRYDESTGRYLFLHKVLRDWWCRWHPCG